MFCESGQSTIYSTFLSLAEFSAIHWGIRTFLTVEVDVDGTVLFHGNQRQFVLNDKGVYLIHDLLGVLYVDRTPDLQRRFDEHRPQQSNSCMIVALSRPFGEMRFYWIRTHSDEKASRLDPSPISWLQLACNHLIPNS